MPVMCLKTEITVVGTIGALVRLINETLSADQKNVAKDAARSSGEHLRLPDPGNDLFGDHHGFHSAERRDVVHKVQHHFFQNGP